MPDPSLIGAYPSAVPDGRVETAQAQSRLAAFGAGVPYSVPTS